MAEWYELTAQERLRLAARRMREVADLIDEVNTDNDNPIDLHIPEYYTEFDQNCTVRLGWDSENQCYEIDKDASIKAIAKIAAALPGKKEKVMDESGLSITYTTASGAQISFSTDKAVTCTKKVVGQKWVEAYNPTPRDAHYEDVVEWECDEIVLLKHS